MFLIVPGQLGKVANPLSQLGSDRQESQSASYIGVNFIRER